jgi:long-chain acyl-CoA synthetase
MGTDLRPGVHAAADPERPAAIAGTTGEVLTYGALEDRSARLAGVLRSHGLGPGDHVALLVDNQPEALVVAWAVFRAGCYLTPVNWHLGADEAAYIVEDCGARVLVATARLRELVEAVAARVAGVEVRLALDGDIDGFAPYADAVAAAEPIERLDEVEGGYMFYSSGTTGRPKGIKPALSGAPFGTGGAFDVLIGGLFGFDASTVYLCPAPLYHAAPLGWSMAAQRLGATVVVMERFDPVQVLELVERHRVTHAQFVPTHFVRMLKLPEDDRRRHDLSSLRMVVHAAAPCPVPVKRAMIEWLGPIVHEYYSGSEGVGFCTISPQEWLDHPGSVGRAVLGVAHIVGEHGGELPAGETGEVWFETPSRFEYHNDPEKTTAAWDHRGWSTLGDIGHVDDEGFLYLTDRVSHTIISGGVNIYPREAEDVLVVHPSVADAAVIGVPDEEMGERVLAVVEPMPGVAPGPELEAQLLEHCRAHLAGFKCPREVDFVDELPRLPTGKVRKGELRKRYGSWSDALAAGDPGADPEVRARGGTGTSRP